MRGPSIEFSNVGLQLGATRILEDITFSITPGSVHCIIGANGGGKTSLVRSMLGQMPHTGTISINWQDNRTIGYVPQTLDFDRTLPITVYDFLAMSTGRRPVFLGISSAQRNTIDATLDRVGMHAKGGYRLGSLSGGERQRVLFAQAMLPEPALLVLDEPMTGLDVDGHDILEKAIVDYAARGGTVVWVNHDILKVSQVADKVTYIDRKMKLNGPAAEALSGELAATLYPALANRGEH